MTYPPPPGPPSYPSGPPAAPAHLRGRRPLQLGIIFMIVGVVLIVVGAVVGVSQSLNKVNKFQRVAVSAGSGSITLNAGNYVAYYEDSTITNSTRTVTLFPVQLTSPSGTKMLLQTLYGGNALKTDGSTNEIKVLTYQNDGHNGIAMYQFKVTESGTYQVALADDDPVPGADVAFGQSIAKGIAVGGGLVVGGVLLFIAGAILLIIGLVKRRRHKKQLASGGGFSGGAPAGYPAPGYGQPYQGQPYPGQLNQGYPAQPNQGYPAQPQYGAPQPEQPQWGTPPPAQPWQQPPYQPPA